MHFKHLTLETNGFHLARVEGGGGAIDVTYSGHPSPVEEENSVNSASNTLSNVN